MQPLNKNSVKDWDILDGIYKTYRYSQSKTNMKRQLKKQHKQTLRKEIADALFDYYEEEENDQLG